MVRSDYAEHYEPSVTDSALIRSCVDHPAEFSLLYERHLAAVAGYLTRRVGGELAEDLTAEVFVRAFRGRHGEVEAYAEDPLRDV